MFTRSFLFGLVILTSGLTDAAVREQMTSIRVDGYGRVEYSPVWHDRRTNGLRTTYGRPTVVDTDQEVFVGFSTELAQLRDEWKTLQLRLHDPNFTERSARLEIEKIRFGVAALNRSLLAMKVHRDDAVFTVTMGGAPTQAQFESWSDRHARADEMMGELRTETQAFVNSAKVAALSTRPYSFQDLRGNRSAMRVWKALDEVTAEAQNADAERRIEAHPVQTARVK